MHNNTIHTHMIEIITEQKNEVMTITSQYVICLEASNLFYKLNSYYWISYNRSETKHTKLSSLPWWGLPKERNE